MFTLDLSGKTAVVLGVANKRSLAYAIARELDAAGVRQAFTYQGERLREGVEKLASEMEGSMTLECDVADDAQVAQAFRTIGERFGKIDYLVHSIAFAKREDLEEHFADTSRDGFRTALEISAYSLLAIVHHASAYLQTGSSVISLSYLAAERYVPNYNVMGTAKAALEQITRQLAGELGPKGIRVNCISAGPVNTVSARGISGFQQIIKHYEEYAPLRRSVSPDEVGRAALFLLSDMGSGITGTTLHVDAGYSIVGL